MATKAEQIETIAKTEVFPARYNVGFPGLWPSEQHRNNCIRVAEGIYKERQEAERKAKAKEDKAPVELVDIETPDETVE